MADLYCAGLCSVAAVAALSAVAGIAVRLVQFVEPNRIKIQIINRLSHKKYHYCNHVMILVLQDNL